MQSLAAAQCHPVLGGRALCCLDHVDPAGADRDRRHASGRHAGKMASNYLVTNIAFQNAEGVTRRSERAIEAIANRKSAPSDATVADTEIQQNCDTAFDPMAWARNKAVSVNQAVNVRRIDSCIIGGRSRWAIRSTR